MAEETDLENPPSSVIFPKRGRGRPRKNFSEKVRVKDGPGRPSKQFGKVPIKTTMVFAMNKASDAQIIVNRGGARSSKSWSIMQLLVEDFFSIPKIRILILRKASPSLRRSCKPLFYQILEEYGLRGRINEVKQDSNVFSPVKGMVHFSGLDDPEKIKCFHPDTEILTSTGFKNVSQIAVGELVATMNPDTRAACYQPVAKFYNYDYSGDMVSAVSNGGIGKRQPYVNFCVTDNHTMLISKKGKILYTKINKLTKDFVVPQKSIWSGRVVDHFEIPRLDYSEESIVGHQIYSQPDKWKANKNGRKTAVFPIKPWLQFLGWYLSEGHTDGAKTVFISQKKDVGRSQIRLVLEELGYGYNENKNGFAIYGKDLSSYLSQFGDCYSKFIPREILGLHPSLLRYLFDALVAGDGYIFPTGRINYGTSSQQLANDVCELAIKIGLVPSISSYESSKYYPNGATQYTVCMNKKDGTTVTQTKKEHHDGKVYCVEVPPYHNILIRYKGKICWCGQSTDWNEIFVEEASEFDLADYRQLKLRLSSPTYGSFRNRMFLSFNPQDENSWLKTDVIDNPSEDLIEIVSNYRMNPFLSEDYRRTIEALKHQDYNYWRVFSEGQWGKLDFLIYSNWKSVPEIPQGEVIYGLDFGFNNPSVLIKATVDNFQVGVEQKLYMSGLTNSELIAQMNRVMTLEERERCPIYCDSAEPARIQELNDNGYWCFPADKSIKDGIDWTKRCQLLIKDDSDELFKEIKGYSYQTDKNGKVMETPVKFNDHCLDALRYCLWTHNKRMTRDIPGIRTLDWSSDKSRDEWGDEDD